MSDFKETCVKCVTMLAELHEKTATKQLHHAYQVGLRGLTVDQIKMATTKALQESQWMPKPCELRKYAGIKTPIQKAKIAWSIILKIQKRISREYTVDFARDRTINAVIDNMGGWPTFLSRLRSDEEGHWVRREFISTYTDFCGTVLPTVLLAPLNGTKRNPDKMLVIGETKIEVANCVNQPRISFKRPTLKTIEEKRRLPDD